MNRSLGDAACYGGMVGFGQTYFAAFALAAGLGEAMSGIVVSVPVMVGGVLQLCSQRLAVRFRGLKQWIVMGSLLQAACFLPLIYAAFRGQLSVPTILIVASLYWTAGFSVGPSWNAWVENVIPADGRVRFFAHRTRLQQICTFAALMIAGVVLSVATTHNRLLDAFAALFAVAAVARFVSALLLHRTEAANVPPGADQQVEPSGSIPSSARSLLVYLILMQAFIHISGPFFVPYMLSELEFTYGTYVTLISLAFVSKVVATGFWGRTAETHGATRVLWFGGLGLVPLAALWTLSASVYWIAMIQITSGVAWAAYELGIFLTMFDRLPAGQRRRLLTYYNFAGSIAISVGALTGAAILSQLGCCRETYCVIFACSSAGRLLCVGLLVGVALPVVRLRSIQTRFLSIRPGAGSIVAPIVSSVPHQSAAPAGPK